MHNRSVRLALAAAAVAAAVPLASPATAVPPLVVTGAGQISWGLWTAPPSTPPYPAQSLAFQGTASTLLTSFACAFSGSGTTTSPNVLSGTMSGSCGPYAYPSCTFVLTHASWDFTCGTAAGSFAVQPANVNPTTVFTATGTIS